MIRKESDTGSAPIDVLYFPYEDCGHKVAKVTSGVGIEVLYKSADTDLYHIDYHPLGGSCETRCLNALEDVNDEIWVSLFNNVPKPTYVTYIRR